MRRWTIIALGPAAALGVFLATTFADRPALAQTAEDKAAAEALFDEGRKLFLAKRFAQACPKLEASQKLDPGIGNLLYLADCYEGLGRTASAWAAFREAAGLAQLAGQSDREKLAKTRASALEPKLHKLTIAVAQPDTPGLEVKRNDANVKRAVWGSALPVDPGSVTISASAPGKKPWSTEVKVHEGPGADTVSVPALEDAPVAAPPPTSTGTPVAPPPPPPKGLGTQRIAGIAVGATGLVALGLAATFGGLAMSANSSANEKCPDTKCSDQDGVDAAARAGTFADVSTGLFIAGGAVAATGLIVFLTAPSSKPAAPSKERAWITPVFGSGFAGISAGRTW